MSPAPPELREFQRRSCSRACEALFGESGSRRFLVADEVGLGKTRVAKGVIAAVKSRHVRARRGRVVVYVAANAEIGRQNGRVLRGSDEEIDLPSRPTLLPLHSKQLRAPGVHILTFTPMTALRLRRGTGTARERALLFHLLRRTWRIPEDSRSVDIFRVHSQAKNFKPLLNSVRRQRIDSAMAARFKAAIQADRTLKQRFRSLMKKHRTIDSRARNKLVGELRETLARTALQTLKPELVVLDEFQKFRWVVEDADNPKTLAGQLLGSRPSLLLSATPYRMGARAADDGLTDDDLLPLFRFLYKSSEQAARARDALSEMRWTLEKVRGDDSPEAKKSVKRAKIARRKAQALLTEVMCRSERPVGSDEATSVVSTALRASDIKGYVDFQAAVDTAAARGGISHRQTVEYWKSAPFLFNFMRGYKVKQALREARDDEDEDLARRIFPKLRRSREAHLDWRRIHRYEEINVPNGRTRQLASDALDDEQWKLLWVPPTASPYRLAGPFHGREDITKQLVFSGWTVVPTSVSAMVGYAAERRAAPRGEKNDRPARKRRSSKRLLDFKYSRSKGPSGAPVMALCFPSTALASIVDPYELAKGSDRTSRPSLPDLLDWAEARVSKALQEVEGIPRSKRGRSGDVAWYWLAPLMLDQRRGVDVRGMLRQDLPKAWLTRRHDREGSVALEKNLARAEAVMRDPTELGPPPRNLPRILAELAIGGPGPVALRSLSQALGVAPADAGRDTRIAASRIAWALRGLLGRPDATLVIQKATKGGKGIDHWRRALRYCCEGGLAPMLDEYLHLIRDDADAATTEERARRTADQIVNVAGLEPLLVRVDDAAEGGGTTSTFKYRTLSSRFAAPFGATMTEDAESIHPDTVRRAFNSPFWPWVLVTTSVGQEGLDFHRYCHSIVHWNVPISPVELEQREGRVRWFLSHGVRKNLAADHAADAWGQGPPWEHIRAAGRRAARGRDKKFAPEWVYGEDQVRATVLAPPFSRDEEHFKRVRRRRVFYRLALGQPNPHELVEAMVANLTAEKAEELMPELRLDLSPAPDRAAERALAPPPSRRR